MRHDWMVGGASATGIGIWSMHFIGMLAMSTPMPLRYDVPLTLASLRIAIVSSWVALQIAHAARSGLGRLGFSGLVMGGGIAGMHYLGMAAIDIAPAIRDRPTPVAASVVVGIVATSAALGLAFRGCAAPRRRGADATGHQRHALPWHGSGELRAARTLLRRRLPRQRLAVGDDRAGQLDRAPVHADDRHLYDRARGARAHTPTTCRRLTRSCSIRRCMTR